MQFNDNDLAQLFFSKQAAVFCGAGVSLEPPAGLPDWHSLRDSTLKVICSRNHFFTKYLDELINVDMLSSPGKKGLTPEIVASQIMRHSNGYFESFKTLNRGMPNTNHRYIAQMAKSGNLSFIITTNFDLFIEQALEDEGILYKTYITEKHYRDFKCSTEIVRVLKLHGCISIPETITASVEQQARGLSKPIASALEQLLEKYHFVFWGYSGADLKINLDYLRMVTKNKDAVGFTWNFLEREGHKEEVNEYVTKLMKIYGEKASIVYGKLPEIFNTIVAPENQISATEYTHEEEQKCIATKNIKLEKALQRWAKKHISKVQACRILVDLQHHTGNIESSLEILEFRADLERKKRNYSSLAICYNKIGGIYHQQANSRQAIYYFKKALEIDKKKSNKRGISIDLNNIANVYSELEEYEIALEYHHEAGELIRKSKNTKSLAIHMRNVGRVYQSMGNYEEALALFEEAKEISISHRHKKSLGISLYHLGRLFSDQQQHEKAIKFYEESRDIDKALGHKRGECIALNGIGNAYKSQKMYEKALEYYMEVQQINRSLGNKRGMAIDNCKIASVYHEQKKWEKALPLWKEAEKGYQRLGDRRGLYDTSQALLEVHEQLGNIEDKKYYVEKTQELSKYLDAKKNEIL